MHRKVNILLAILLVLYIFISILVDLGDKDLPFIFFILVLLFSSILIRQKREKTK